MGILTRILDHDLHRSRSGARAIPYMIEIPVPLGSFPVIISNTRGGFIINSKSTGNLSRVGIFDHDSDKIDDLIPSMFEACFQLSKSHNFKNLFKNPFDAFDYVNDTSGLENQPHVCLVPSTWGNQKIQKWLGKSGTKRDIEEDGKSDSITVVPRISFKKVCRMLECEVKTPVFLSRPDLVGMYTQFMGSGAAIILHNVRHGMAFVECS